MSIIIIIVIMNPITWHIELEKKQPPWNRTALEPWYNYKLYASKKSRR